MSEFKLNNLRALSTEEQLRLQGGVGSGACNCECGTCTGCSCNEKTSNASATEAKSEVVSGVRNNLPNK